MNSLPSTYFGPIAYYLLLIKKETILIDVFENYKKQTYRNRCEIYGANGKLSLSIPVKKHRNHTSVGEILIAYEENWQALHWKSIQSAYRSSPYFEYYETEFLDLILNSKFDYLVEFNQALMISVCQAIGIKTTFFNTKQYQSSTAENIEVLNPKKTNQHYPKYIQVFSDKHGFISNLSILDLLFNLGPSSIDYLNSIQQLK